MQHILVCILYISYHNSRQRPDILYLVLNHPSYSACSMSRKLFEPNDMNGSKKSQRQIILATNISDISMMLVTCYYSL